MLIWCPAARASRATANGKKASTQFTMPPSTRSRSALLEGVDQKFLEEQAARAAERAARFATMPDVPPIEPRKRIAWPGGKMVTNREVALHKFLKRRPSKEEQAKMLAELRGKSADERERLRTVDAAALQAAQRDERAQRRGDGNEEGVGSMEAEDNRTKPEAESRGEAERQGHDTSGARSEGDRKSESDEATSDDEDASSADEPDSEGEEPPAGGGENGRAGASAARAQAGDGRAASAARAGGKAAAWGGGVVWKRPVGPPPRRALDDPEPVALRAGSLIALTGHFADRGALQALLEASGLAVSPIVHRRVAYVVATDTAVRFQTQHVRKALKRGIPVVSEPWLRLCLILQRQHAAAAAKAREGAGGALRSGRKGGSAQKARWLHLHWRLARHNPYRMLALLPSLR